MCWLKLLPILASPHFSSSFKHIQDKKVSQMQPPKDLSKLFQYIASWCSASQTCSPKFNVRTVRGNCSFRHLNLEITELRVGRVQDAFLELLNQNVCHGDGWVEWKKQTVIQPTNMWIKAEIKPRKMIETCGFRWYQPTSADIMRRLWKEIFCDTNKQWGSTPTKSWESNG